jgi:hypothetical protein
MLILKCAFSEYEPVSESAQVKEEVVAFMEQHLER